MDAGVVAGDERRLRVAFVFTGQGAQWAGMGLKLMQRFPAFARKAEEVGIHKGDRQMLCAGGQNL
jgi:acyl transferase domain-containing protein